MLANRMLNSELNTLEEFDNFPTLFIF